MTCFHCSKHYETMAEYKQHLTLQHPETWLAKHVAKQARRELAKNGKAQ